MTQTTKLRHANTPDKPVYHSFAQARKQIGECEAIDYFLAKQLLGIMGTKLNTEQQQMLFHLLLALSESLRQGHSCLFIPTVAGQCIGFATDTDQQMTHPGFTLASLPQLEQLLVLLEIGPEQQALLVYQRQRLYLRRYFQFESQLASALGASIRGADQAFEADRANADRANIARCMQALFPDLGQEGSPTDEIDWQQLAVANALNKHFSVIAGGPGTGKTYTVTKVLAAFIMLHQQQQQHQQQTSKALRIALVAPTGKAAQRLSESISQAVSGFRHLIDDSVLDAIPSQAQTVHRLLGVIAQSPNFRHNQDNLLALDVLLIDEVSMVDLALMTRIYRALPEHCKVVLLGDADQLPSVAAGSVLADLAVRPHPGYSAQNQHYLKQVCGAASLPAVAQQENSADYLTFLHKSRRFDDKGGIGLIARAVIAGQSQQSWQLLNEGHLSDNKSTGKKDADSELTLLNEEILDWLPALVKQYYLPLFKAKTLNEAFTLLGQFRVLCATRKGAHGVEVINEQIKAILMEKARVKVNADLYHGLPIMISENNYALGLYNGDIGIVWRSPEGYLIAAFEDAEQGFKQFMPSRLPKFETVYAMTIHKTQGSEFSHVAMVLPTQAEHKLLSRELLYTGITRAKKRLSIASSALVWRGGVTSQVKRYSGLNLSENNQ